MNSAAKIEDQPTRPADRTTIGLASLMAQAYAGRDLAPTWNALLARAAADPGDAAALMDISILLQLGGQREQGLAVQAQALALARVYRRPYGRAHGPRLLALAAAGDFMANTPLDFLLEGSDVELITAYLGPDGALPNELPEHDVAFLAVGESPEAAPVLAALPAALGRWPRPLLNGRPERIAALTRDGVAVRLAGLDALVAPPTHRYDRAAFARASVAADAAFPIIVRPIGSHAGKGLEKLDDIIGVSEYLQRQAHAEFFVAPYVDYSGDDGLFRKQRIVFVRGRPFICHMAVSEHWMVHYLSAGMRENDKKREEEALFMRDFEQDFAVRHRAAFAGLNEAIGLDYFGIDCAETRDGRLLIFEVDVAMIVHALDDPDTFPYKLASMRKMFGAFTEMLQEVAASSA